jgi:hypothetical protein
MICVRAKGNYLRVIIKAADLIQKAIVWAMIIKTTGLMLPGSNRSEQTTKKFGRPFLFPFLNVLLQKPMIIL